LARVDSWSPIRVLTGLDVDNEYIVTVIIRPASPALHKLRDITTDRVAWSVGM